MAVQHGCLSGRGPVPYVDEKVYSKLMKTRQVLISGHKLKHNIICLLIFGEKTAPITRHVQFYLRHENMT